MMINSEGNLKFIDMGMLDKLGSSVVNAGSPLFYSPAKSVLNQIS